jgi:hypothetical protein
MVDITLMKVSNMKMTLTDYVICVSTKTMITFINRLTNNVIYKYRD